ncbi:MAG: glycosyltransferase family 2 protein [Ruminococcaceae bacterium]|nr:glycosyltransferase family 2 protein [Oscillospiraceae bacterium]MBQ3216023.1 glycosyltransferase family 2 protein [Oscillospiraceae bacterium]
MPKLSAVVPVYKVEGYLGQLIESLQNQTLQDIQIILVDDGSPDRSGAICDEYAAKDSRIKVIHKKNGGVGAARNDGLAAAEGQWVYFCDSDDYLELDALQKLVEAGEKSGAEVVYGDVALWSGTKMRRMHFHERAFASENRKVLDQLVMTVFGRQYCYLPPEGGPADSTYGGPWNKIVRRELLEREKFQFDLSVKGICDDLLYSIYLFSMAKSVAYEPVIIYNYRLLGNSITHTYKANLLEINTAIFAAWEKFMSRYGADGQFRKPYHVFVIRRLKATLGMYFFSGKNPKPKAAQYQELKALLSTEPYRSAIAQVEPDKLQNRYDKMLWKAAKAGSPRRVYYVFKLSVLAKKLKG